MSKRILVVEDEPDVLAVCRTLCDPTRYEVSLATNLEAARLWLERSRALDLAVVSAGLADGRGAAFCGELKAARPAVPVLVVASSEAQREAAEQAGADGVLMKPVTPEALEAALARLLPEPSGRRPCILHPTDFSPAAERARELALELARALGAELTFVHVHPDPLVYGAGVSGGDALERLTDQQRRWAAETLEARVLDARGAGVAARAIVARGAPDKEIVRLAEQLGARLIVMGAAGDGGVTRLLLGSVAGRVIRTAPCPVVTVREP